MAEKHTNKLVGWEETMVWWMDLTWADMDQRETTRLLSKEVEGLEIKFKTVPQTLIFPEEATSLTKTPHTYKPI